MLKSTLTSMPTLYWHCQQLKCGRHGDTNKPLGLGRVRKRMEVIDIEYVAEPDNGYSPVVADFTNGQLQCIELNDMTFKCYEAKRHQVQQRQKKILIAESDSVKYVGKNFGRNVRSLTTNQKFLVGVYSKCRQKVQLFDSQYFQMVPSWQDDSQIDDEHTDETTESSFRDKTEKLAKDFGSARERRLINARQRNQIKEDDLETSIRSAVDMATTQISNTATDNQSELLPVCNKSASRPEDVYQMKDLITDSILELLHTPAKLFVDSTSELVKEWKQNQSYPLYILNKLCVLPMDTSARCQRAAYLVYLNYLFLLYLLKPVDFRKKNYLPADIPTSVKEYLLNNFTTLVSNRNKQIRCMSARLKDKTIFHILIICLILDQFTVDYTILLHDLKTSARKLSMCFRAIGCQTSTRKSSTAENPSLTATLKLPLKFPEVLPKKKVSKR